MRIRFVIRKVDRDHYLAEDNDLMWTAYLDKAVTYKTYQEAETVIGTLPPDFYSIDKIFKV